MLRSQLAILRLATVTCLQLPARVLSDNHLLQLIAAAWSGPPSSLLRLRLPVQALSGGPGDTAAVVRRLAAEGPRETMRVSTQMSLLKAATVLPCSSRQ